MEWQKFGLIKRVVWFVDTLKYLDYRIIKFMSKYEINIHAGKITANLL